jgi:hypothetical protein
MAEIIGDLMRVVFEVTHVGDILDPVSECVAVQA